MAAGFHKVLYCHAFPFCKTSPVLVSDSCNAPVYAKLCGNFNTKIFLKILNLLYVVCEQQGMEYLGRRLPCFVHVVYVIQTR